MRRRTTPDGLAYYASERLERIGVSHAFSTRVGGVSPPPFDSMNLGNPSTGDARDEWSRVHENYRLLQQAVGWGGRERCWVHQVHGGDAVRCDGEFRSGMKADAIVGSDPDRLLAVRVADCVPVLLATADGRHVAAVHAGWRGVIAGVVPAAVRMLREQAASHADELIVAVGPCIGFDAFEVGPEVLQAFYGTFHRDAPVRTNGDGKGRVDLRAAVRLQLLACEVKPDHIDISDRCTYRDRDEFFSHRRDNGVTGRMAALIAPRRSA